MLCCGLKMLIEIYFWVLFAPHDGRGGGGKIDANSTHSYRSTSMDQSQQLLTHPMGLLHRLKPPRIASFRSNRCRSGQGAPSVYERPWNIDDVCQFNARSSDLASESSSHFDQPAGSNFAPTNQFNLTKQGSDVRIDRLAVRGPAFPGASASTHGHPEQPSRGKMGRWLDKENRKGMEAYEYVVMCSPARMAETNRNLQQDMSAPSSSEGAPPAKQARAIPVRRAAGWTAPVAPVAARGPREIDGTLRRNRLLTPTL